MSITNCDILVNAGLQRVRLNLQPSIFSQARAASVLSWKLMNAKPLARCVSLSLAKKTLVTRPNLSNISRRSCSSASSLTYKQKSLATWTRPFLRKETKKHSHSSPAELRDHLFRICHPYDHLLQHRLCVDAVAHSCFRQHPDPQRQMPRRRRHLHLPHHQLRVRRQAPWYL